MSQAVRKGQSAKAPLVDDAPSRWWRPRISLRALENYCRRLSISLKAGVDITRILESEEKQGSSRQRRVATDMVRLIRGGSTLAQAFAGQGSWFPKLLIQMVTAGETAGGLDRIFMHMADHYRDLRDARSEFLKRIAWPAIQFGLALFVISGTILLQGLLSKNSGVPTYDAASLGLSGISGFLWFWFWVLLVFGILGVFTYGIWKNWFHCHQTLIPLVRNVPIIGTVFTTVALSRLSMTLSMLLNAGVDAKRCVQAAFKSTGNYYYIKGLKPALQGIEKGKSLGDSFRLAGVFPDEFIEAVDVGEMSGSETESLEYLASDYLRRSRTALTQLSVATSIAVWLSVSFMLIFMILRMALQYVNTLNSFL